MNNCISLESCEYWFCRTNKKCLLGNSPNIAKIINIQTFNTKNNLKVKRRWIHWSVKKFVFERDGNKCVRCGSFKNLTIDHKIPLSKGGIDFTPNFQTMCKQCNFNKGDTL